MRVSLIGLGTVGQGVVELLRRHHALHAQRTGRDITIVAALVRDPDRPRVHSPRDALITGSTDEFFNLPSDLVVEVAGGIHPALELLERALTSGRDVVTANKALLATHAPELFKTAEQHRRRLLFEAAVAGGVPIIRLVNDALASNQILSFAGILNGTCNFILTEMSRGGTYAAALAQAQQRGFAEADPTLDVSGADSLQKLIILSSLAFDAPITHSPDHPITSHGITHLTPDHLAQARNERGTIKLLAYARRSSECILELHNGPMFVPDDSPLSRVDGSDMGVLLHTDALRHMFVAGDGAGRFPTASAVVADVLEAARLFAARDMKPLNRYPTTDRATRPIPAALPLTAGLPTLPTD